MALHFSPFGILMRGPYCFEKTCFLNQWDEARANVLIALS